MHRWTRSWITTIVAWVAVMFIGGAAIAGVGSQSKDEQTKEPKVEVEVAEAPEVEEVEEVEVEKTEEASAEEKADNHGQCVSAWAHKAKEGFDGSPALEGRFKGGFISAVAQSDGTGAECDQSDAWAEWQAEQDAGTAKAASSDDDDDDEEEEDDEDSGDGSRARGRSKKGAAANGS